MQPSGSGVNVAIDNEITELKQKVEAAEKELGAQVTWASTPKNVPVLRRKTILFSGVLGARRQYAFATELDRELFVYDRHDTLFTVSRDIRAKLGLTPPIFKGSTVVGVAPTSTVSTPAKKKNKFRK